MQSLKLLEVKTEKIIFNNNIIISDAPESVEIQIGTNIASVVNYDNQNARCKCTTTVTLEPQNLNVDFKAIISVVGIFEFDKEDERREIHIAACKTLFPHVQSRVTSFLTMVGYPNFIIEEPQVSVDDVHQDKA